MAASKNDLAQKTGASTVTTLAAPGKAMSATSITVGSTTNYPTDTGITIAIRVVDSNGELVAGTYTEWSAIVTSGTTLGIDAVPVYGSDQVYAAGSTTQVYIPVSAYSHNRLITAFTAEHSQLDGTHTDITADSIVVLGDVEAASFTLTGAGGDNGWSTGLPAPNTVTYNGNRSYDLVFNSTDLTDTVSEGMRLRTTRTVSAPTQCADLESGSSQYFSSASAGLAGMTFTDDFTCMAWIKPESYGLMMIEARDNGTNGWAFYLNASGQLVIAGQTAGNDSSTTYQSVPLGKWTHVAATLDSSGATSTMYIDGVLVPSTYTNGAGTTITQGGDFYVGRNNGGNYFDGKLAQVAVFSSVLSASTIRSYMSQGLAGTESTLVSAYSCNNSLLDLNTTNNNDLTANGGAAMTNVDSPFGNYLGGTLDYGIITKTAFSTNTTLTVQVPEGCTIPTSGGVSAVSYSTQSVPYGFPRAEGRWIVEYLQNADRLQNAPAGSTYYNLGGYLTVPVGTFKVGFNGAYSVDRTVAADLGMNATLSTSASAIGDLRLTGAAYGNSTLNLFTNIQRELTLTNSATAPYYLNVSYIGTAPTNLTVRGGGGYGVNLIYAIPAYL